jgi:hypothetical protein
MFTNGASEAVGYRSGYATIRRYILQHFAQTADDLL